MKTYQKSFNKDKKEKPIYSYQFIVDRECLLLDFLIGKLSNKLSRNNIKTILKNKCVLVNGVVCTHFDYLLTRKNTVDISKYPIRTSIPANTYKKSNLPIIYEDENFIVINKPSGLLSIASDSENEKTAYHYLLEYERSKNPKNQIFIVHRLDKDTSGVLMVCKNKNVRDTLQEQWNKIVSLREYYAIVEGTFKDKKGTIKSYLTETSTHVVYSTKSKDGKFAITNYEVLKENKEYSLVKVNIDSGRKNQIRVHMKEAGHPVVGDGKYGNEKSILGRLGLHASKLKFTNPLNHKEYEFSAKMPPEFNKIFK